MPLARRLSSFGVNLLLCVAAAVVGCDSTPPTPATSNAGGQSSKSSTGAPDSPAAAAPSPLKVILIDDPPLAEALQRTSPAPSPSARVNSPDDSKTVVLLPVDAKNKLLAVGKLRPS